MIPNSDVTIYNKYIESHVEKYQRAEVYDVVWQSTEARSGAGSGRLSSNVATIFIPYSQAADYVLPKAWQIARTGKWTLQVGDVVVRNIVTDEITTAFTMSNLKATYDDVVTITSVDDMDQGTPQVQHFQIGAK